MVLFEVLMQHLKHVLQTKDGAQRLVLSEEAKPDQAVPLYEVYGRWRVLRLKSDYAALDLWRWLEAVPRDFD